MSDTNDALEKLYDPSVQMRALNASKNAIIAQLKEDGVEVNQDLLMAISKRSQNRDDASAALLGVVIGSLFSDSRLKENIVLCDRSKSGLNVYEFNYKGSSERWRGVIADELVASNPDAVHVNPSGFLSVDYARIDVEFKSCP